MSSDKTQLPAIWKKAASTSIIPIAAGAAIIRNCNNDEEESASSAKRIPNPRSDTSTNADTIRSHSPRKMKTQIAKLVYNPSTTTKSNRDDVNENQKVVTVTEAEEEFQKKRQDRDREVKEIQEMLNEITKTPTKQQQAAKDEPPKVVIAKKSPPKQPTNSMQRSKTETNLRRPTARKVQPKQEPKTARCKSAHVEENNNPPKQRQKTYSSEEAQRYMQEQKKKRRSLQATTQGSLSKNPIDRDEIKKRLENLRLNTRKIVDKNIKVAKKKSGTTEDEPIARRVENRNILNKEPEVPLKATAVEDWSKKVLKAPPSRRDDVIVETSKETGIPAKTSMVEAWAEKVRIVNAKSPPENRQDPSPLAENHKKIGLLRKPEFKDHSFSAIKDIHMDKENLIADILTPQVSGLPTYRLRTEGENLLSNVLTPQNLEPSSTSLIQSVEQQSITSSNKNFEQKPSESSLYGKSLKRRSSPELDLKVPEAKLRSRTSMREKSVQVDSVVLGSSKVLHKNTELPYWLKPTLVQAYPYNFIMAVRKKLEAIANPPAVASSSSSSIEQQAAKKMDTETPVSYTKINRNNNVKRRIIDEEDNSIGKSVEKSSSNKENIGSARLSKSFSEVTSNFSSISIQLPESKNTISALKTKPQQVDEDATTVSSSIFSSPEKKKNFNGRSKHSQPEALSPLSMDNISNLHIKSKSMMSNITLGRGDDYENTSSHRKLQSGSITNRSNASIDFSQLLDDFNRSLSQVIEVNQQLKTTLVKSQIFSPEKKNSPVLTTDRVELAEYVSDFEESSNADEKTESNKPFEAQSGSSIQEVPESSKQSSEINTQKSSSASSSNEEVPEEVSERSIQNIQSRSVNQSPLSLGTQTFIVSSEEKGQSPSTRTQTIHEEAIEESPNKENMSANQYSLDSLETSQHEDYIKSHINTSRGVDYERIELSVGPPPSYKVSSESQPRSSPNFINSSLDREFVRIFNKSDMEISVCSLNRSLSESTVNYSSIGVYEKLIQNETNKSEHLAALLKMREKALIDRTKGQIAWLEVQKERYKSKGLVLQISAVKKKQRGILLKMEKEREEIKKLLQRAKVQRDDNKLRIPEIRPFSDVSLLQQRRSGIQVPTSSQQKQQQQQNTARSKSSSAIVRGYELETSRSLEQLLQKREEDLRRRREHVERLMEWHRRLDQEEAEVLQLERILLDYNNVHVQQQQQQHNDIVAVQERNPNQTKMEKKLKDIDRSLRELSSISGADGSTDAGVSSGEFVRTSGTKLNKLWRRLTSQRIEKFQPNKRYKLCKADVEQLYEDAKLAVLRDFGENAGQMEVFLGQTSIISTPQPSNLSMEIPQLNLNFSSGQSEDEIMMRGNYSPSAAEEGFVVPSTSSREGLSDESSSKRRGPSCNSLTSALQSLPECYSSNSSCQMRFENAQRTEDESTVSNLLPTAQGKCLSQNSKKISTDLDSKSGFSTKNLNVPKMSINYVLSSKADTDPRVSDSDSSKNCNRVNKSESAQDLESSTKSESVPNKDSSSKIDNNMLETLNTESNRSFSSQTGIRTNQANKTDSTKTFKSLVAKSDIPEILTESHGIASPIESEAALTRNSTNTLGKLSNTIESIDKLTSVIPELSNSNSSNATKSIETLNSQINKSTMHSISEISEESAPEITACSNARSCQIETICSSHSANIKSNESNSKFIEPASTQKDSSLGAISTESDLQSELENSFETENTDDNERCGTQSERSQITDGNVTSLKESISRDSKNTLDNVAISGTSQSENISNIKTPTQSIKSSSSSIETQTLNSVSAASSSSKNNVPFSDIGMKIEAKPTNSETEIRSFIKSKVESKAIGNVEARKAAPVSGSVKSSEDCATVSILKSLLNSTYNSNSIFVSNQASSTASDIEAKLRTNGHDFQNWTNTLLQAKPQDSPSPKDEHSTTTRVSRTEFSTYPDEATLRSIKSIENSTNSKHSIDPVSNHTTIASEEDINLKQIHNSKTESYSSAFEDSSTSSNQIRSSVIKSIKTPPPQVEVESDPPTNAFYESDFTEGEETNIDDLSLPKFETTGEDEELTESQSQPPPDTTDFEKRLIDLDVSLKDLDATFEKALSPEKNLSPPRDEDSKRSQQQNDALMPDIISEVELRRRHQAMLENELKQFEHAVPYMYVREIPNKPPPPYVPPAHGSPMTTIFPSEERIKDITFRRTKELYYEILNIDTKDENGKKPPSVLDENITNIYERIILDICKEYLIEYKPILTSADPNNFHSSLAFFNPPDRLRCMQEFIYKEVRKNLAMDKNVTDRNQLYSVYGHRGKRDHIGEIIIQEMYEEDNIWSNFYVEEEEVLELILEEIVSATVRDICTAVLEYEVPSDSITPIPPDADECFELSCNNST